MCMQCATPDPPHALPFSKLFSMNHKPSTPPLQISSFREGKIHLPEPSVNQKCLPNPPAIRPALTSMTVASRQSYKGEYAESTLVLDCNACCMVRWPSALHCHRLDCTATFELRIETSLQSEGYKAPGSGNGRARREGGRGPVDASPCNLHCKGKCTEKW